MLILNQSECTCPGSFLIATCSVVGGGSTVWLGSAFECSPLDEILLLHSNYASNGAEGECNNGDIVARSQGVVGRDCFVSQLTVLVTLSMHGKSLQCVYDNGVDITIIGNVTINVTRGKKHQ